MRYLFSILFILGISFPLHTFALSSSQLNYIAQIPPSTTTKREPLQNKTREKARETFKEKLSQIKDEKKKNLTKNIDERIAKVNQTLTATMSNSLTRMSTILATAAATSDSIEAKDAVANAEILIEDAKDAVATQQEKDYVITIVDETTLREAVKETLSLFRNDIRTTHQAVAAAREAVIKAVTLIHQEIPNTSTIE
ncbi:MAG: hypothetical protein HZC02_05180 [Candidatus Levybacteria bacterium]|nr:hypothetical protein [Candidatus Levybacteria bacterium]